MGDQITELLQVFFCVQPHTSLCTQFLDKQNNGKPIDYLCDYSFVLEEFEVVRKSFPTLLQINFELYFTEIISL